MNEDTLEKIAGVEKTTRTSYQPGIRPSGTRVLIETFHEAKSAGGIFLPESHEAPIRKARVIAVGQRTRLAMDGLLFDPNAQGYEPGQIVLLPRGIGYEIQLDNRKLILVEADQILATPE